MEAKWPLQALLLSLPSALHGFHDPFLGCLSLRLAETLLRQDCPTDVPHHEQWMLPLLQVCRPGEEGSAIQGAGLEMERGTLQLQADGLAAPLQAYCLPFLSASALPALRSTCRAGQQLVDTASEASLLPPAATVLPQDLLAHVQSYPTLQSRLQLHASILRDFTSGSPAGHWPHPAHAGFRVDIMKWAQGGHRAMWRSPWLPATAGTAKAARAATPPHAAAAGRR